MFVNIWSIFVTPTHICYADQSRKHFFLTCPFDIFLSLFVFLVNIWSIFARTNLLTSKLLFHFWGTLPLVVLTRKHMLEERAHVWTIVQAPLDVYMYIYIIYVDIGVHI